jgi:hypothetical protein
VHGERALQLSPPAFETPLTEDWEKAQSIKVYNIGIVQQIAVDGKFDFLLMQKAR